MDDNNKSEPIHKVAKVHFAKEVTALTVEETDGKVIIPVRKVSVLTTSGQLWEATIGAFIYSAEAVTKMYMEKRDIMFKKMNNTA